MDEYTGKVVKEIKRVDPHPTYSGLQKALMIEFTDGNVIYIRPNNHYSIAHRSYLIETTLDGDVIPIGADTLGQGGVK